MERPELDHVAVGIRALAEAPTFLEGELGGSPFEGGPGPGYVWRQWQYAGGGLLEVLEPDGPAGGFLHRFLDRHGPGIHHVTFKVPSLREACARAEQGGHAIVGVNDAHPGWKEAFLHPRHALGIVVQLVEIASNETHDLSFPATVTKRPPPVELVGVRLSARSAARARTQWEGLLHAETTQRDGELRFRWPGSPIEIAVTVDPGATEGPVALEIASPRELRLPAGAHPSLGTRFVHVSDRGSADA